MDRTKNIIYRCHYSPSEISELKSQSNPDISNTNKCCCTSPDIIKSKLNPNMVICKNCLKSINTGISEKKIPVNHYYSRIIHKDSFINNTCPRCSKSYYEHDHINLYKDGKTGWLECN
jgi:transcription elongation factor Elf1